MAFEPAHVTAQVGDTIEWTNQDFVQHSATARKDQWDQKITPNGKAQVVLKQKGDVEYYCRYHPTMNGIITVEDAK